MIAVNHGLFLTIHKSKLVSNLWVVDVKSVTKIFFRSNRRVRIEWDLSAEIQILCFTNHNPV